MRRIPTIKASLLKAVFIGLFFFFLSVSGAHAATYTVTKTADTNDGTCDADCSLREAITAANANSGADTINFNIPTSDSGYRDYDDPNTASSGDSIGEDDYWTIKPTSAFPNLATGGLTIDGSSQTANQGDTNTSGPEIEIDAISAGNMATTGCAGFAGKGLFHLENLNFASATTYSFKSLVINDVQKGSGISVGCGGINLVFSLTQSYIGTNVKAAQAKPNTIGSGNTSYYGAGILFLSNANSTITIGGNTTTDRNIISGNQGVGINFTTGGNTYQAETSVLIKNNYIGTDRTGMIDLGNGYLALQMSSISNATVDSNLISGNARGIGLAAVNHSTISNNIVGLNADQTAAIPNDTAILDWRNWSTDGTVTGNLIDNNVIAGNSSHGMLNIHSAGSITSGTISNNKIGTDSTKTKSFPNRNSGMALGNFTLVAHTFNVTVNYNTVANNGDHGIVVDSSSGVILQDNDIYNNGKKGVLIEGSTAVVKMTRNLIHNNSLLPIDISGGNEDGNGVTANDSGDVDTGVNNLMNHPVITRADYLGDGKYHIDGTLDRNVSEGGFVIELCESDSHGSGHGGCLRSLGTTNEVNATGAWSMTVTHSGDDGGQTRTFSALATNNNGSTSEFSANVSYLPPTPPTLIADVLAYHSGIVNYGSVITILEGNILPFDAYLDVTTTPKVQAEISFVVAGTTYWQASPVYEIWWRAFFNKARILPEIIIAPHIFALRYTQEQLGQLPERNLKLAYSANEGKTWRLLPSVLDIPNKTVATLTKLGGHYMLVSGYPVVAPAVNTPAQ